MSILRGESMIENPKMNLNVNWQMRKSIKLWNGHIPQEGGKQAANFH